jgi:hypothetical protein
MEARLPVIEITLFCDRAQIPDSLSHVSGLSATLTKAQGIPDAQCDYGRLIGLNNRHIPVRELAQYWPGSMALLMM